LPCTNSGEHAKPSRNALYRRWRCTNCDNPTSVIEISSIRVEIALILGVTARFTCE
jgi:hypothetical protein